MTKAEAQVGETVVEIDTTGLEERILKNMDQKVRPLFEKYMKEVKEWKGDGEDHGKGVVEAYLPEDRKKAVLEQLQKGKGMSHQLVNEQWTIALPRHRTREMAAHMRDYVYVTDVIKGSPGDTVNIPYVRDVEFAFTTVGTGSWAITTGLVGVLTATLFEAGAFYDCYYSDIEKIDANLLDELNSVFAHAAIRSEDAKLIDLLCHGTTSAWGETKLGATAAELYTGVTGLGTGSTFAVTWIADAIGKMLQKGKDIQPGEMIMYMPARVYITLLKKLSATTNTAVAYAMPTVWTKGMVESFLGVKIVIGGWESRTTSGSRYGAAVTSYVVSFLMRPKRCLALGPKRELLIETDKQIEARTLRIVASHTFAATIIDQTEAQKIFSGIKSTGTTTP